MKTNKSNPRTYKLEDLPVVILCGGKGTRIRQLTSKIPKPLIPVGDKPIVWHIMKYYSTFGIRKFILCLGYKGMSIKKYFMKNNPDNWELSFIDTGIDSSKSMRVSKIYKHLDQDLFFLTYGDDLSDVDLVKLLNFQQRHNKIVTISAVRMVSEFGIVRVNRTGQVMKFEEKPILDKWVNGGYMLLKSGIFKYLHKGELEKEVFNHLVKINQITAYRHRGNWKAMNNLKDHMDINTLWYNGNAFWKKW